MKHFRSQELVLDFKKLLKIQFYASLKIHFYVSLQIKGLRSLHTLHSLKKMGLGLPNNLDDHHSFP